MIQELIEEHIVARRIVTALYEANKLYSLSGSAYLSEVVKLIKDLVKLYPEHIQKEDKRFFYPCLAYLTREEQDAMLQAFWEFDRNLIHEKYQKIVEEAAAITS